MAHQDLEALASSAQASPAELAACSLLYTEDVLKNSVFLNFSDTQKQEFVNALSPLAKLALVLVDKSLSWVLDVSQFDDLEIQVYRHSNFYLAESLHSSDAYEFSAVYEREGYVRYDSSAKLEDCFDPKNSEYLLDILRATDSLYVSKLDSNYFPDVFFFGETFEKDRDEQSLSGYAIVGSSSAGFIHKCDLKSLSESLDSLLNNCRDQKKFIELLSDFYGEEMNSLFESVESVVRKYEDEDTDRTLADSLFDASNFQDFLEFIEEFADSIPSSIEPQVLREFIENLDKFEDVDEDDCFGALSVEPGERIFELLCEDGESFRQFTWEISLLSLKNSKTAQSLSLI